ncbi:MAG: preprotein translocase subunit SecG [Chloroflexi bacterium]|nr:preprotein translocase subunit SecG [Chloroflexota bacterium]
MVLIVGIIHVLLAIGLIVGVLLHSGKGTGLSNMFGGGMPSTFSGTGIIEKNLNRITVALAIGFASTTMILYFFTLGGRL